MGRSGTRDQVTCGYELKYGAGRLGDVPVVLHLRKECFKRQKTRSVKDERCVLRDVEVLLTLSWQ